MFGNMFIGGQNNDMMQMFMLMNMMRMSGMWGKSPLVMSGNMSNTPMQSLMLMIMISNALQTVSANLNNASNELVVSKKGRSIN